MDKDPLFSAEDLTNALTTPEDNFEIIPDVETRYKKESDPGVNNTSSEVTENQGNEFLDKNLSTQNPDSQSERFNPDAETIWNQTNPDKLKTEFNQAKSAVQISDKQNKDLLWSAKMGNKQAQALIAEQKDKAPITGKLETIDASIKGTTAGLKYGLADFEQNVNNENLLEQTNWFLTNVKGLDVNAPKDQDKIKETELQRQFFRDKENQADNELHAFYNQKAFKDKDLTNAQFINEYEKRRTGTTGSGAGIYSGTTGTQTKQDKAFVEDASNRELYKTLQIKQTDLENKSAAYKTFQKALSPNYLKMGLEGLQSPAGTTANLSTKPIDNSPIAKDMDEIVSRSKERVATESVFDIKKRLALHDINRMGQIEGALNKGISAGIQITPAFAAGLASMIPGGQPFAAVLGNAAAVVLTGSSMGSSLAESDEFRKQHNLAPNDALKYAQMWGNGITEFLGEQLPLEKVLKAGAPIAKKAIAAELATNKGVIESFNKFILSHQDEVKKLINLSKKTASQANNEALSEAITTIGQQWVGDWGKDPVFKAKIDDYLSAAWETYYSVAMFGGAPGVFGHVTNQQQINQNRQKNGVTLVKDLNDNIGEVVGDDGQNLTVIDRSGTESQMKKSDVIDELHVSKAQFDEHQLVIRDEAQNIEKLSQQVSEQKYIDNYTKQAVDLYNNNSNQDSKDVQLVQNAEGKQFTIVKEWGDKVIINDPQTNEKNMVLKETLKPVGQMSRDEFIQNEINRLTSENLEADKVNGGIAEQYVNSLVPGDDIRVNGKIVTVKSNTNGNIKIINRAEGINDLITPDRYNEIEVPGKPAVTPEELAAQNMPEQKTIQIDENTQLVLTRNENGDFASNNVERSEVKKTISKLNEDYGDDLIFEVKKASDDPFGPVVIIAKNKEVGNQGNQVSPPEGEVAVAPVQENTALEQQVVEQPAAPNADNVELKTQDNAQDVRSNQEVGTQIGKIPEGSRENSSSDIQQVSQAGTETSNAGQEEINQKIAQAESEVNTEPTEKQIEAGNYKKGHVKIQGLDISIETPKGSTRTGTDPGGQKWEQQMNNSYGYIKTTQGKDGDQLDVFLGHNPENPDVYVIDQITKEGNFDEHKVMLGFTSQVEAEEAYRANYKMGWDGFGGITKMPIEEFRDWMNKPRLSKKPLAYIQPKMFVEQTPVSSESNKNKVIDNLRSANESRKGSKESKMYYQKASKLFNSDQALRDKYSIKYDSSTSTYQLIDSATGNNAKKDFVKTSREELEAHKTITDYENKDFVNFVEALLSDPTEEFFGMVTGISSAQKQQAARDIRKGKKSSAANQSLDEIERQFNNNTIAINLGNSQIVAMPITDVLEAISPPESFKRIESTGNDINDVVENLKALSEFTGNTKIEFLTKQQSKEKYDAFVVGSYNPNTGVVYFVPEVLVYSAKNKGVNVVDYALSAWAHEVGLHKGIRGIVKNQKDLNKLFTNIFMFASESGDKDILSQLKSKYKDAGTAALGEEYLAYLTEKLLKEGKLSFTKVEQTVWDKIVDFFDEFIRKVLENNISLSHEILEKIIQRSFYSALDQQGVERTNAVRNEGDGDGNTQGAVSVPAGAREELGASVPETPAPVVRTGEERNAAGSQVGTTVEPSGQGSKENRENPQAVSNELDLTPIPDEQIPFKREELNEGKKEYKTKDNKAVQYQLSFGKEPFASPTNEIQQQANTQYNDIFGRKLKPGEFCHVERVFTEKNHFSFTGKEKIETADDVAFIFRSLENAAVENFFLVAVKEGKATIIHTSIGAQAGTVADHTVLMPIIQKFNPDTLYFLHNHPSGSINPSREDVDLSNSFKRIVSSLNVKVHSLIINVDSGFYTEIDQRQGYFVESPIKKPRPNQKEQSGYKVFAFDKQVFHKDVSFRDQIHTSRDVAQIISAMRFSDQDKQGALLLSYGNRVNANILISSDLINTPKQFADQLILAANNTASKGIILYGRYKDIERIREKNIALKNELKNATISLLDIVDVDNTVETNGQYTSFADEGTLAESKALSPADQKRVDQLIENIDKLKSRIVQLQKDEKAKINEIAKRTQTQSTLEGFGTKQAVQQDMFAIKADVSQENIEKILAPFYQEIARTEAEVIRQYKLIESIKRTAGDQMSLFKIEDARDQIAAALNNANIKPFSNITVSNTDYGQSIYFSVVLPSGDVRKVRISDHDATNAERIRTELMYSMRRPISEIIESIEKITNPERFDKVQVGERKIKIIGGNYTTEPIYSYTRKNPLFKLEESPEVFYSNTLRALDKINQEKATSEQWMAMLVKNGAKQSEMDWMGLPEYLKENPKLTKSDLTKFVNENKVELKEVVKAEKHVFTEKEKEELRTRRQTLVDKIHNTNIPGDDKLLEAIRKNRELFEKREIPRNVYETADEVLYRDREKLLDKYIASERNEIMEIDNKLKGNWSEELEDPTKFKSYVLPGGKNYKEWLLTMPVKNTLSDAEIIKGYREKYPQSQRSTDEMILNWVKNPDNMAKITGEKNGFKSSHWDEANVIAHMRSQEMTDKELNSVLLIEEIQSDWQQKGRKEGFAGNVDYKKLIEEGLQKAIEAKDSEGILLLKRLKHLYDTKATSIFQNGTVDLINGLNHARQIFREESFPGDTDGNQSDVGVNRTRTYLGGLDHLRSIRGEVPDMPFKNTDQIIGLGFKRMLREAADNGFDKLAWTTGEQQAERYDLSKQIKSVNAENTKNTRKSYQWDLTITDNNGNPQIMKIGDDKELADMVGKDLAEKIIADNPQTGSIKQYSGLDLKVGGEGMKGFYDKMIPAYVAKYLKPFGGKVETTELSNGKTVHSVTLTPAMYESAISGQALFKREDFPNEVLPNTIIPADVSKVQFSDLMGTKTATGIKLSDVVEPEFMQQHPELADTRLNLYVNTKYQGGFFDRGERFKLKYQGKVKPMLDIKAQSTEQAALMISEGVKYLISNQETVVPKAGSLAYGISKANQVDKGNAGTGNYYVLKGDSQSVNYRLFPNMDPIALDLPDWDKPLSNNNRNKLIKLTNEHPWAHWYLPTILSHQGTFGQLYKKISGINEFDQISNELMTEAGIYGWTRTENGVTQYVVPDEKFVGLDNVQLFKKEDVIETPEFKAWFGDSKVVDDNGNPLVVYHGSKAKFDVFELNKANRIGASEGYGFYFTDNKNIAEGYRSNSGDLFEVYLSIKNPLNKDAKPFNNTELSKIIKAAVANEIKENKGDIADYKDTFLSNIADTYSTNFNNSIKEAVKMLSENDSAIDQIAELANIMGSENIAMRSVTDATGYDGIYVKDFQGGEGDVYLAWYPEQIKSATGNKGTFDPENPSILFKKEDDPGQEEIKKKLGPRRYLSGDEIQREILQDKMLAVKKFQDEVKRLGGIVTDETDAYHQENHSASIGMEKMNQAEEKYVKPLLDTVMKIAKETKTDFIQVQKYMKAKHAPERNATKRVENKDTEPKVYAGSIDGNLLTDEYANQYVKNFESKVDPKDIEKLWKQLNALTETNLKMLFDYGNISKDSYNHLKNMWKYYVPLRGWEDNMTEVFKYQNEDIGNNSLNLLKKAKGRTSESDDPLPYLSSMLYSTIAWGEKNAYKQSMLNLVDENQKLLKGKVEAKDTYYVKTGVMDENGREEIKETLVRPDQKLFDEGKVSKKRFTGNLSLRPREASIQHEVPVMIGGEKVVLVFNDELVEVANALNHNNAWAIPDEVTRIFQASVGKVTRTLGMLATSKNPAFLVPNMTRDVAYAWLANSIKEGAGIDFAMNLPHAMGAITTNYFGKPDINNKYDLLYKQWKDNGGPTGYLHSQGIDELKNDIEKIYKRYTGTNSYLDKTLQLKAIKKAGELFNALAAVSEEVSRFATFLTSVGNGKSVFQAVTDSKEVTTNFNTKGLSSAFIGSNYMFFNASVQGANNALGLMGIGHKYDFDNKKNKNSRAKKMMAVGASFMALGFFNAMICKLVGGKDDQDDTLYYDKINPYVKHNNLIIPAGKGHHWSIPMPFFFRAFFGAGAAAHDVMTGSIEAGNAIGTSIGEFANAFVPIDISAFTTKKGEVSVRPLIPSYTTGIYDVLTNQDFAGHMIAREAFSKELENLIPDSQLGMKSVNPMIKFTTDLWFKCWGGDPSIQSKGYISGGEQHIVPGFADINPSKAEYLLEYYTGGLGKFFNQTFKTTKELISAGVKTAKGEPDPFEDFSINDIPIANRFYRDVYGDENMKQFAKLREETATYMNLYKQFKKPANIDKFETLLTPDNMSLMLKYKMFDALNSREKDIESSEKTILDLTADIIQAENNKQSSVDLKKERADRIKEFMDIMKEVGIKK